MRLFSALYNRVITWSRHPHAPRYLASLSFAESSFFPIPPDVMLVPMSIAQPEKAWWYALLTTIASVIGGAFGYIVGMFFLHLIKGYLIKFGYWHTYELAVHWFEVWGVLAIIISGFAPIPYKIFTIGAGAVGMPFIPFTIASFFGRGGRFFLVAGLMRWGGKPMERVILRYIDICGWILVALCVIGIAAYYLIP